MGGVTRLTNLTTGGPVHVDVKDGRIVRIVPSRERKSSKGMRKRNLTPLKPPARAKGERAEEGEEL